jgi:CubicO group peptidase (beta-lactamase class C family)
MAARSHPRARGVTRRGVLAGLGATAALLALPGVGRAQPRLPAGALERVSDFVELVRTRWHVPGLAVAVVCGGEPVLTAGFGVKNLETRAPVDRDTAFHIGSCTKAYTATAAALLVAEGRIGWDDPVKATFPELALYDAAVTEQVSLRDLLSHRVGLSRAYVGEYGSDLSHAEVLGRAASAPKRAEFRAQHCYSNLGFVIAAETIGRLAGMPFEAVLTQRILEPLAMTGSRVAGAGAGGLVNVADPHSEVDYRVQPVPPMDHTNVMGAGNLYVSAQDAAAWLRLQLGRTAVIDDAELSTMHTAQVERPRRYGLGWEVNTLDTMPVLTHSGQTRGFTTRTRVEPLLGYASFVVVNAESAAPNAITGFMHQVINGRRVQDWVNVIEVAQARGRAKAADRLEAERKADPINAAGEPPLAAFAGRYRHGGLGELTLAPDGEVLRVTIKDAARYDGWLVRYGASRFAYQVKGFSARDTARPLRLDDARVHFTLAESQATAVEFHDMYYGSARFERI